MSRPLPPRDGVSASAVFLPAGVWPSLLAFLCERFPDVGEVRWRVRMEQGSVVNEAGLPQSPETPYRERQRIYYYREVEQEARIPFDEVILFEDEHIVVADKPHFLPTAPVGQYLQETLLVRLKRQLELPQLVPLHRLDRETAGVVMFSKNVATRDAYHALFRGDGIVKTYEAIASYRPDLAWPVTRHSRIERAATFYRREEVPGEPNATSVITLLEAAGDRARYGLTPVTGKTHQLRLHMAALGLPILNDPLYPEEREHRRDDYSRPLQLLARTLGFTDPVSGQQRRFQTRQHLRLV